MPHSDVFGVIHSKLSTLSEQQSSPAAEVTTQVCVPDRKREAEPMHEREERQKKVAKTVAPSLRIDAPHLHSFFDRRAQIVQPTSKFKSSKLSTLNGPPNEPEEFSSLGWIDSTGRRVFFSAGDPDRRDRDRLAESLARALRGAQTDTTLGEKTYQDDIEEQDPLFCPSGEDSDITAEELNQNLFGPDAKSEWFPYPDKAVNPLLGLCASLD
ncbi:hypothetical protein B0H10DRAFT_1958952 [Mycena sp. CBHHK59/15]|nr:hypothetical protein B0H10DRAFT_1958952 [Mycena sp. CBHHK59/15]